ncbi:MULTISPECIES: endonuclease MutS2 [unclassified Paenibacillus]|uniref:endonuclease MutS2 n=1 Tax=unclassified Paenibacillus TaxID=185978 RepID=UPI0024061E75|nr:MULTISPECIES: endonuclease MutS2 [unclassified Paenibacillus]MDF9844263.1 DNA mismatch repair protein MutS2 [Paenibacillus sp. PastF-2]MDF9850867.1 DNA mismatch repair protein MutS2 [Paenibacillus sp. PastM-2]MDF9857369.1 DNA mismatch repair protein MutS2 [Paenibacillus sp. PastF-1]MDH6482637.1 DNA mismatch repair protein MutS2 [Paenibacillus sp. PastH-2]MDH6510132.1 DNA mismatch repair protein MutS2 [Paenibacillus sp. PastM-3]
MDDKILHTLEYRKILNKLMQYTQTPMGRLAAEELKPSGDFEGVKRLLQATDEAVNVDRLKGIPSFGGVSDIRPALKRASIGGMLGTSELLSVGNTIGGARRVKRFLAAMHEDEKIEMLYALSDLLSEQKHVEDAIRACIDEDANILDSASSELANIRRELRGGEARIREKLDSMIRSSSVAKMLQDQLVTIRGDRFVIPVKAEYRSHFGGIVHDQSGSGATLFIEPESIVAMNNKLRETRLREEREIEIILHRLTDLVGGIAEEMAYDVDILGQLDFIFAKARIAREMKATQPRMNDRGYLKLRKGRHPLIPAEHVVPLDAELGNQYSSIIVTGPNTGGKTVTLKTVGLLSLMSMSGLFIPAEEGSQMCVFDAIYADIGDEQSIEQSLSTFSSHMTNIISILKRMTPKSLILLDEVGAGTDPAEGSALAIAILEHIHRTECRMIATTHYSELKAYAYERKGVINASMEFDVQTLSPTYRLLIGVPGRSNAFAIAERLGLPGAILEHARGEVKEEDLRVEHMIASLEENRLTAEQERERAEVIRREAEEFRKRQQLELEKLESQRDKRLEKAEKDASAILDKARKEAEEIISDLRRLALEEGASVKEHKLIEARRRLDEAEPAPRKKAVSRAAKAPRQLQPGDEVKLPSVNQKGYIVELSGTKEAVVQFGVMKMKVNVSDLEFLASAPDQPAPALRRATTVKRTRDENVRSELDLRGANLEEAIMETDRFIDEAFLGNLGQIYIIHGKGTGVLRTGIQEYLRKHRHVKSYRLGNYNEGGAGVTVAELE